MGWVLGSRLDLGIGLGCKVDKIFLRAPLVPMERRAPLAPMDSEGRHLWQLTAGQRPPRGHEATDTGFAYAPVSQAHGHHHSVQCFALLHCSAYQFCTTPGGF